MNCPACGSTVVDPVFNPGAQPLAAFNLPKTKQEAVEAKRFPMNFYNCRLCGHIFNRDFDVSRIPYTTDTNLMYNSGEVWKHHIQSIANIALQLSYGTIIDVGAGDGLFLEMVSSLSDRRCIAFEPGIEAETCSERVLETYQEYFQPDVHMGIFKPSMITLRHVVEHLEKPREFLERIWRHSYKDEQFRVLIEVPSTAFTCFHQRPTDFLYEHPQNFSLRSLKQMCELAGFETQYLHPHYNGEVLVYVGEPKIPHNCKFLYANTVDKLNALPDPIVFWGGTGKGSAFLNVYKQTRGRVVDSDPRKVGRYVPGTGQLIESVDTLLGRVTPNIVITTRWRVEDIVAEMCAKGIKASKVYYVESGEVKEWQNPLR